MLGITGNQRKPQGWDFQALARLPAGGRMCEPLMDEVINEWPLLLSSRRAHSVPNDDGED
jgi:hypothetical protein